MGLDKWIKPEEDGKKDKKKDADVIQKKRDSKPEKKKIEIKPSSLSKFVLICPKARCKYQKTLMKKELTAKDRICPKCKSQMKIR